MPFGHDCEYETFDACVKDQQSKGHDAEAARRICGALQRDTEEKCRRRGEGSAEPHRKGLDTDKQDQ